MLQPQTRIGGIIGGVGPSATLDFCGHILSLRGAGTDQENIRYVLDQNCHIPDRTKALLAGGPSPVAAMVDSGKRLKQAGAEFLAVPCNTAHAFLAEVSEQVGLPCLHMIRETMKEIRAAGLKTVGLLSTKGTAATKLYQSAGEEEGVEVLTPDEAGITNVMTAIYGPQGIKAGKQYEQSEENRALLLREVERMKTRGIRAAILGCTELPLCLPEKEACETPLVNPTRILAQAFIRESTQVPQG